MKKITIAIFMLLSYFSIASAELGINIGVSAQLGIMEGSGSEGSTAVASERETSETKETLFAMGSYFAELELGFLPGPLKRITLGYDNIAHDIEFDSSSNVGQAEGNSATGANSADINFHNKVSATIDGFETLYATVRLTDWLYVKGGQLTVDVKTTESLNSSDNSYGNASLDGTLMGVGLHHESDNGLFFRVEWNDYKIDGVTLASLGTTSNRSVTLNESSGQTGRISVGKAF
tara:strand:+ start:1274 stop:1975 length:702 start_codon:yes stop_codon:yes gene_type:complete